MIASTEGLIYLLAGACIAVLYSKRKRGLARLAPDIIPEVERTVFFEIRNLLETCYERTFLLGVCFLFLAVLAFTGYGANARPLLYITLLGIFFYNIPPRNRVMKILNAHGISVDTFKERGIRL